MWSVLEIWNLGEAHIRTPEILLLVVDHLVTLGKGSKIKKRKYGL